MTAVLPLDIYRQILTRFPSNLLEDLKLDHELISRGWHLHFAVDHRVISQFCFPIEVERLSGYGEAELERVSCQQNALYELFFNMEWKPIMLRCYYNEVAGLRAFISKTGHVYASDQIIGRFIKEVGLRKEDLEGRDDHDVVELCKKKLSSVLAIALSVHSIGAARFDRVTSSRMAFNRIEDSSLTLLQSTFDGFKRSSGFRVFHDFLSGFNPKWKQHYVRDADGIDKVIQKNHELLGTGTRALVLFMSSAPNVKRLFEEEDVRDMMPMIGGHRYGILRTPEHLFSYLLTKGDRGTRESRAQATLRNIEEVQRIQNSVAKIAFELKALDESGACALCKKKPTKAPDCRFRDICDGLEAYGGKLEDSRQEFFNTGLIRAIDEWVPSLARGVPEDADKYRHYIQFVIDLQTNQKSRMLRELQRLLDLAGKKARFASDIPGALNPSRCELGPQSRVTCVLQRLPTRPKIQRREMQDVLALLAASLEQEGQGRLQTLSRMLGRYMELDASLPDDPESELVRCIIYLAFEEEAFFEVSFGLATDMADRFPEWSGEFWYVASFAARLLRKYSDAIAICDKRLQKDPCDPRLHHSRSIAIYCWKEDELQGTKCGYTYGQAIESAMSALSGYRDRNDVEMMAVNYNNVAYFSSAPNSDAFDVRTARRYLRLLIKAIRQDKWDPAFPEFFDTEASVLLAWASQKRLSRHPSAALRAALAAQQAQERAIRIYSKEVYRTRLAAIKGLVVRLQEVTR